MSDMIVATHNGTAIYFSESRDCWVSGEIADVSLKKVKELIDYTQKDILTSLYALRVPTDTKQAQVPAYERVRVTRMIDKYSCWVKFPDGRKIKLPRRGLYEDTQDNIVMLERIRGLRCQQVKLRADWRQVEQQVKDVHQRLAPLYWPKEILNGNYSKDTSDGD